MAFRSDLSLDESTWFTALAAAEGAIRGSVGSPQAMESSRRTAAERTSLATSSSNGEVSAGAGASVERSARTRPRMVVHDGGTGAQSISSYAGSVMNSG